MLFRLDPERVHHATVESCRLLGRLPGLGRWLDRRQPRVPSSLVQDLAGVHFPNPLGLAAGWDKSGRALRLLDHLGFGSLEIGSVSARPSRGNPQPRLFRLPQDRAIIVHYGLPNDGAERVAQRLARFRPRTPLGINVVKTNDGPAAPACAAEAIYADYHASIARLHPWADYLMLNLSCPNTRGDGDFFADPNHVTELLQRIQTILLGCPVFLKVAPDPDPARLEGWLAAADPFPFVRGFMFNLPREKPAGLQTPRTVWAGMPGAVAGPPVAEQINRCLGELYSRMPAGRFVLIGGGGVFSAEDAYLTIQRGASLVQIYTALIYEGPGVIGAINQGLADLLARDGFSRLADAVGVAAPPVSPV